MTIRPVTTHDHDGLWSIIQPVIQAGDTYVYAPDTPREAMLAIWLADSKHTYVAEQEGVIMGTFFICANQPGLGAHVANAGYMVHPDHRGKGIAKQLCLFSLTEARRLGFRAMQFNAVVATNTVAVRLWEQCGFRRVGTVPKAFQHQTLGLVDTYVMHQRLGD